MERQRSENHDLRQSFVSGHPSASKVIMLITFQILILKLEDNHDTNRINSNLIDRFNRAGIDGLGELFLQDEPAIRVSFRICKGKASTRRAFELEFPSMKWFVLKNKYMSVLKKFCNEYIHLNYAVVDSINHLSVYSLLLAAGMIHLVDDKIVHEKATSTR